MIKFEGGGTTWNAGKIPRSHPSHSNVRMMLLQVAMAQHLIPAITIIMLLVDDNATKRIVLHTGGSLEALRSNNAFGCFALLPLRGLTYKFWLVIGDSARHTLIEYCLAEYLLLCSSKVFWLVGHDRLRAGSPVSSWMSAARRADLTGQIHQLATTLPLPGVWVNKNKERGFDVCYLSAQLFFDRLRMYFLCAVFDHKRHEVHGY